MDIYYCPEQKNKYIALLMPAGKKEADNLFRKSCRTENSLGKDVCRFQLSEIGRASCRERVSFGV